MEYNGKRKGNEQQWESDNREMMVGEKRKEKEWGERREKKGEGMVE